MPADDSAGPLTAEEVERLTSRYAVSLAGDPAAIGPLLTALAGRRPQDVFPHLELEQLLAVQWFTSAAAPAGGPDALMAFLGDPLHQEWLHEWSRCHNLPPTRWRLAQPGGNPKADLRIAQKLGGGGFGTVYQGVETALKRDVAVKVSHAHWAAGLARRQWEEARRLAELGELSGVLRLYSAFVTDETRRLVLVTELATGGSLAKALRRRVEAGRPPLSARAAVRLLRPVVEAVGRIHELDYCHRDLKPHNILFKGKAPVVADLGLAVRRGDPWSPVGGPAGSHGYMSPEQARGEAADFTDDLFSLGVILYELLTHQSPYPLGPPSPRSLNPAAGDLLDGVCQRLLAPARFDRYQSAGELLDALDLVTEEGYAPFTPVSRTESLYTSGAPARRDYKRGRVELGPAGQAVAGRLRHAPAAAVEGPVGSGKTVLAAVLGWGGEFGPGLYLDLGTTDVRSADVRRQAGRAARHLARLGVLTILDNAHAAPTLAARLVEQWGHGRRSPGLRAKGRLLYLRRQTPAAAALPGLVADPVRLAVTRDELAAAYRYHTDTRAVPSDAVLDRWLNASGGDMVVFSMAAREAAGRDPTATWLDPERVAALVRRRYLTPLTPAARNDLLVVARLARLELPCPAEVVGGEGLRPLVDAGHLVEAASPGSPAATTYQLAHPGLGDCILRQSGQDEADALLATLTVVADRAPDSCWQIVDALMRVESTDLAPFFTDLCRRRSAGLVGVVLGCPGQLRGAVLLLVGRGLCTPAELDTTLCALREDIFRRLRQESAAALADFLKLAARLLPQTFRVLAPLLNREADFFALRAAEGPLAAWVRLALLTDDLPDLAGLGWSIVSAVGPPNDLKEVARRVLDDPAGTWSALCDLAGLEAGDDGLAPAAAAACRQWATALTHPATGAEVAGQVLDEVPDGLTGFLYDTQEIYPELFNAVAAVLADRDNRAAVGRAFTQSGTLAELSTFLLAATARWPDLADAVRGALAADGGRRLANKFRAVGLTADSVQLLHTLADGPAELFDAAETAAVEAADLVEHPEQVAPQRLLVGIEYLRRRRPELYRRVLAGLARPETRRGILEAAAGGGPARFRALFQWVKADATRDPNGWEEAALDPAAGPALARVAADLASTGPAGVVDLFADVRAVGTRLSLRLATELNRHADTLAAQATTQPLTGGTARLLTTPFPELAAAADAIRRKLARLPTAALLDGALAGGPEELKNLLDYSASPASGLDRVHAEFGKALHEPTAAAALLARFTTARHFPDFGPLLDYLGGHYRELYRAILEAAKAPAGSARLTAALLLRPLDPAGVRFLPHARDHLPELFARVTAELAARRQNGGGLAVRVDDHMQTPFLRSCGRLWPEWEADFARAVKAQPPTRTPVGRLVRERGRRFHKLLGRAAKDEPAVAEEIVRRLAAPAGRGSASDLLMVPADGLALVTRVLDRYPAHRSAVRSAFGRVPAADAADAVATMEPVPFVDVLPYLGDMAPAVYLAVEDALARPDLWRAIAGRLERDPREWAGVLTRLVRPAPGAYSAVAGILAGRLDGRAADLGPNPPAVLAGLLALGPHPALEAAVRGVCTSGRLRQFRAAAEAEPTGATLPWLSVLHELIGEPDEAVRLTEPLFDPAAPHPCWLQPRGNTLWLFVRTAARPGRDGPVQPDRHHRLAAIAVPQMLAASSHSSLFAAALGSGPAAAGWLTSSSARTALKERMRRELRGPAVGAAAWVNRLGLAAVAEQYLGQPHPDGEPLPGPPPELLPDVLRHAAWAGPDTHRAAWLGLRAVAGSDGWNEYRVTPRCGEMARTAFQDDAPTTAWLDGCRSADWLLIRAG